ncbi:hypothetical protein IGS59_25635 [Janthinobacterium sp. GW460P]|uniref:hypothetical protein n=1 Tax=unclassified Janthinobacterium TaxID=2610881 RepID=UPI000A328977|nr:MULTISPECIES: hypothetical protein [unclassified Janthinobacterium]MCC7705628.1 hypothetical protein [Janthinobacterium sp. GW460P]MCC7711130.1 hypothetical protein [Janthinobacterium sp. GW460W]
MTQKNNSNDPRAVVGWLAVLGAVLAWSMAVLVGAAAGFDFEVLAHPTRMLAYSAESQNLYRLSMWADILGWYVPFLAVGGYLWQPMRQKMGAMADIGLAGLIVYAVLGITGAGLLSLTLPPVAELAASTAGAKPAADALWITLQRAAQGIWNAEAPVLLLWGIVAARFLRGEKWGFGRLLTFDICLFMLELAFNLVGWHDIGESILMITLVIHPLWLFLFGVSLLRQRAPVLAGHYATVR